MLYLGNGYLCTNKILFSSWIIAGLHSCADRHTIEKYSRNLTMPPAINRSEAKQRSSRAAEHSPTFVWSYSRGKHFSNSGLLETYELAVGRQRLTGCLLARHRFFEKQRRIKLHRCNSTTIRNELWAVDTVGNQSPQTSLHSLRSTMTTSVGRYLFGHNRHRGRRLLNTKN